MTLRITAQLIKAGEVLNLMQTFGLDGYSQLQGLLIKRQCKKEKSILRLE